MIRFRCKKCSKKLKAEEEIIGRKVKCTRCGKINRVPQQDNLTRPVSTERPPAKPVEVESPPFESSGDLSFSWKDPGDRRDSESPSPSNESVLMGEDDGEGEDDSLELNGEFSAISDASLAGPKPATEFSIKVDVEPKSEPKLESGEEFEPRFKVVQRNSSTLKKWIPIVVLGLAIGAGGIWGVSKLIGYAYSSPVFDSDFEAEPLVMNYRRAVLALEKSDRFLSIASQSSRSGEDGATEDEAFSGEMHEAVVDLTKRSTVLVDASKLFETGDTQKAKALLIESTQALDAKRADIDAKTREIR